MINIMKASLEMIKLTAKANLWLKMDKQLKEFGKILSLLWSFEITNSKI